MTMLTRTTSSEGGEGVSEGASSLLKLKRAWLFAIWIGEDFNRKKSE